MKPSVHHLTYTANGGKDPRIDLSDIWFYCREHERPESVKWASVGCERIGPFESEDEVRHLIKRQHLRGN